MGAWRGELTQVQAGQVANSAPGGKEMAGKTSWKRGHLGL